jgi:hypothetical protein
VQATCSLQSQPLVALLGCSNTCSLPLPVCFGSKISHFHVNAGACLFMATEIPQPTPAIITATAEEEEEQGIEAVRLVVAFHLPAPFSTCGSLCSLLQRTTMLTATRLTMENTSRMTIPGRGRTPVTLFAAWPTDKPFRETTSLTSSITRGRLENGRKFVE